MSLPDILVFLDVFGFCLKLKELSVGTNHKGNVRKCICQEWPCFLFEWFGAKEIIIP